MSVSATCKYYKQGYCKWGDACRFAHSEQQETPVCKFWQQGTCRFGDSCRFKHSAVEAPADTTQLDDVNTSTSELTQPATQQQKGRRPHYRQATQRRGAQRNGTHLDRTQPVQVGMGPLRTGCAQFDYMLKRMADDDYEDWMDEREENMGFTHDELNELLSYGVKPWEEDAWDVLAALHDDDY